MGTIYIIKNIVNDKKYIGLTRRDVNERLGEHLRKAFQESSSIYKTPLSREIRRYNIEAFKLGVLAEDVPDDELEIVEEYYIDLYNTTNPDIGLNLSPGRNNTRNYGVKELTPDDNKDTKKKVNLDEIDDFTIEDFLDEMGD